jgi:hypothetical protein
MHARKLLQQAVQCNGSKMQYLWALVSIKQRNDSDAQGSGLTCQENHRKHCRQGITVTAMTRTVLQTCQQLTHAGQHQNLLHCQ